MKFIIWIAFIASLGSIILGFSLNLPYAEQLIGSGVVGLFVVVIPLFSYYRWKDRQMKDYMLTSENLEKMRKHNRKA